MSMDQHLWAAYCGTPCCLAQLILTLLLWLKRRFQLKAACSLAARPRMLNSCTTSMSLKTPLLQLWVGGGRTYTCAHWAPPPASSSGSSSSC
jgi:hypothetical protein